MNQDQILSLARSVLKVLGAYFIAHGSVTDSGWSELSGVALTAIGVWWSHSHHAEPAPVANDSKP